MWRQVLSAVLWGLLAIWVVGVGPLCWILRDGLGPGAKDSSGWVAVGRSLLTFYWGPVALALAAAAWAYSRTGASRGPDRVAEDRS